MDTFRAVIADSDVEILVHDDGTWNYLDEPKPKPERKHKSQPPTGQLLCDHECCAQPTEPTHRHLFDPADCPLCTWKELKP